MRQTKYLQIRDELLKRISQKEYLSGKLPTEAELSAEFKVNRHTIRRSLGSLEQTRVISRAPGRGSVISEMALGKKTRPIRINLRFLVNNTENIMPWFEALMDFLRGFAEGFMSLYPHVKIKLEPVAASSLDIGICRTEMYAGNTPTILYLTYHGEDAASGKLLNLDEVIDLSLVRELLDHRCFSGRRGPDGVKHTYSVPLKMASFIMFYDSELFRELGYGEADLPGTWSDMISLGEEIFKRGNGKVFPFNMDFLEAPISMTRYLPFVYMTDETPFIEEADGAFRFKEKPFVQVVRFLKALYRFSRKPGTDGKIVFQFRSSWFPSSDTNIRVCPYPRISKESPVITILNYDSLVFPAKYFQREEMKQLATNLIRYALSQETQRAMFKKYFYTPVRHDLYPEIRRVNGNLAVQYETALENGILCPDRIGNGVMHSAIRQLFIDGISDACNAETAVKRANSRLENYFNYLKVNQGKAEGSPTLLENILLDP